MKIHPLDAYYTLPNQDRWLKLADEEIDHPLYSKEK
jgi:hypothetical protein